VNEPVGDGGSGGGVMEEGAPIFEGEVRKSKGVRPRQ